MKKCTKTWLWIIMIIFCLTLTACRPEPVEDEWIVSPVCGLLPAPSAETPTTPTPAAQPSEQQPTEQQPEEQQPVEQPTEQQPVTQPAEPVPAETQTEPQAPTQPLSNEGSGEAVNETTVTPVEITTIEQCLISDETGRWLMLPISQRTVHIREEYVPYLDKIDFELLKAAEKKIYDGLKSYTNEPHIMLYLTYERVLSLYVEHIAPVDEPSDAPCGDHKHITFVEPIVK